MLITEGWVVIILQVSHRNSSQTLARVPQFYERVVIRRGSCMGFLFTVKSIIVLVPCPLLNPSIDAYRPSYHNRHIVKGFGDFWTRSRTCLIATDCPLYSGKHSHLREEQMLKITLHYIWNAQLWWQHLADSSFLDRKFCFYGAYFQLSRILPDKFLI